MLANDLFTRHLCLAVDACSYGAQCDRRQAELQHDLVRILDEAATAAGLVRAQWFTQPAGDGEFAVLPVDQPEGIVVDDYVRHLDRRLARFNEVRYPEHRLRLRLAAHFGPAQPAANGYAGSGPVITGRLVDSDAARRVLSREPGVNLVTVLSDRVFEDTVSAGHTSLRPADFVRVAVRVKELDSFAWLRVVGLAADRLVELVGAEVAPAVGEDAAARRHAQASDSARVIQAERDVHAPTTDHSGPTYVSRAEFHDRVDAAGAVFGMSFGSSPAQGADRHA